MEKQELFNPSYTLDEVEPKIANWIKACFEQVMNDAEEAKAILSVEKYKAYLTEQITKAEDAMLNASRQYGFVDNNGLYRICVDYYWNLERIRYYKAELRSLTPALTPAQEKNLQKWSGELALFEAAGLIDRTSPTWNCTKALKAYIGHYITYGLVAALTGEKQNDLRNYYSKMKRNITSYPKEATEVDKIFKG